MSRRWKYEHVLMDYLSTKFRDDLSALLVVLTARTLEETALGADICFTGLDPSESGTR